VPHALRFEFHHDFAVLEERLSALLLALKESDGPLAPAAVVVPTRRLAAHLQVMLAERLPALLHVRFFNHDSLARAATEAAGAMLPRLAGEAVRSALLGAALETLGGDLAAYAKRRPGCTIALLRTLDDLREAGVVPGSIEARLLSPRARPVLALYDRYAAALDRLAGDGFSDRAGRMASAVPHATAFGARFRLIVHYGAYELIGVNLDLMRAVASGAPVVYLAPGHRAAPAFAYARRFWPLITDATPVEVRPPVELRAPRLLADRLPVLYDEEAPPADPRPVDFFHAQGEDAELREAGLRVAALVGTGGVALDRVAIVARTLEPYAAHLESALGEQGIPFNTTAALEAAREPAAQAALRLARSVVEDYPAETMFELFRGGLLRDRESDPGRQVDAWERMAREGRFASGLDAWTRRLPAWIEAREPWLEPEADEAARTAAARDHRDQIETAHALSGCVRRLADDTRRLQRSRSWGEWAGELDAVLRARVLGFGAEESGGGVAIVREALSDMSRLEAAGPRFSAQAAVRFLQRAVTVGRVPIGSVGADGARGPGDQGGLRVLDAVQARGLSFDALFLLGMNVDLFPRRPHEDPFLPDEDRRRLRETLGRPVPVASDGLEEEHLLLAHLLGAPRRQLTVSWQRADDGGKARVASLALREVARVAAGAAEIEAVEARAVRISAHPADRAREAIGNHGLLPAPAAALLAALESRSPVALSAALHRMPRLFAAARPDRSDPAETLAPALARFAAVEDGSAAPGEWDALPGAAAGDPPGRWSPSRLEIFGSCPQQYFFRQVLRIDEWEAAADPHEIEAHEIGSQVHDVLRDTYAALLAGPAAAGGAATGTLAASAAERALEHLGRAWTSRTARMAAVIRPDYPLLWDLITARWLEALASFIRRDLEGLTLAPPGALLLEHPIEAALPLGAFGAPLPVFGRLDRLERRADGTTVVADYKTSGNLDDHAEIRHALKGTRLQMALYTFLAESSDAAVGRRAPVRAELLGVGPAFESEAETGGARAVLDPEKFAKARDGILETLAVLRDLAARNWFPLREKSRLCPSCPFTRACRKDHAPTLERLHGAAGLADWRALAGKNTRAPTLDRVTAMAAEDDEEDA
jgi:ATP-dependent helicase/nuclease subunit B